MPDRESHLLGTRRAFDSVAATYDGPAGNNACIQRMRVRMWLTLLAAFPPGARLLDLGCGTGIDAVYLASQGYSVVAADWSPAMVERTRKRIAEYGVTRRAAALHLGIQDLAQLKGERFDGIYSNLGPFNCAPDIPAAAHACAALLMPGGQIVTSVIGRCCPWEMLYYAARRDWRRSTIRWAGSPVPVPLNGHVVWTRYFTPRQFFRAFSDDFELTSCRGLSIVLPPPYLCRVRGQLEPIWPAVERLDDMLGRLPLLRSLGDHFLMVMRRRAG